VLKIQHIYTKLEKNLGGLKGMDRLPGAIFVIDPRREKIAVSEANKMGIPVIAVVDTNCDPDPVNFPIPGNDDAIRAIRLFASKMSEACAGGREMHQKLLRSEPESMEAAMAAAPAAPAAESAGPKVDRLSELLSEELGGDESDELEADETEDKE